MASYYTSTTSSLFSLLYFICLFVILFKNNIHVFSSKASNNPRNMLETIQVKVMTNIPLLFNLVLEILSNTIRQEKDMKYKIVKEGVKPSRFVYTWKCQENQLKHCNKQKRIQWALLFVTWGKSKVDNKK